MQSCSHTLRLNVCKLQHTWVASLRPCCACRPRWHLLTMPGHVAPCLPRASGMPANYSTSGTAQAKSAMATWEDSGKGPCSITLQDAQRLAVEAGFTFKGAHNDMALARRADLQGEQPPAEPGAAASCLARALQQRQAGGQACLGQFVLTYLLQHPHAGLFDHFGVNSLSAFRQKFAQCELRPGGPAAKTVGGGTAAAAAAVNTPPAGSSSRSRWQVQQHGSDTYVGELLDGQRHGCGILLTKVGGPAAAMHSTACPGRRGAPENWGWHGRCSAGTTPVPCQPHV